MNKLVNLTPHTVTVCGIAIPPAGDVARCATRTEQIGAIQVEGTEIPLTRTAFGAVEGLPAPVEGTYYIVSRLVAEAVRDRDDLLIPNELIRDEQGRVTGCQSLARA